MAFSVDTYTGNGSTTSYSVTFPYIEQDHVIVTVDGVTKTLSTDYSFSRTDLNRMMRLLPFQNLYGINNILNFIRDESGLPLKGSRSYL